MCFHAGHTVKDSACASVCWQRPHFSALTSCLYGSLCGTRGFAGLSSVHTAQQGPVSFLGPLS